jgi:hypothetical protein
MTELEKDPLNHKFNFFKKKDQSKDSTFVADRASNLMIIMFFQPLILMAFLIIFGFTTPKDIIDFLKENHSTIFNYGLYTMAAVSVSDFITSFFKGFQARKQTTDWGMKWMNKAFSLSMTNFMTYYMVTSVMYPLAKDIFKVL